MNPFSLENKVIIVTGASSGIGKQCAISFSQMGAKLVLIGRDSERLETTKTMLSGSQHLCFSFDVTDYELIEALIKDVFTKLGPISGFVHAAGYEITQPLSVTKVEHYEQILAVNTIAAFEFVKHLSKKKYTDEKQSFVFLSSIYGIVGNAALTAYSASKGALIAGAKSMSIELASKNCRVNTVSPGWIQNTAMTSILEDEAFIQNLEKQYPLGLGQTEDVANACVYLLSDASRWVTGTNLIVDGGYTAK